MIPESQLITALQNGDQSALATIYDKYGAVLYGVILRIVQSEEMAEDVLQEVFIKIWKNAATYNPSKGKFYTWTLNIARNSAIDATRSADFKRHQKTDPFDFYVYGNNQQKVNPDTDTVGLRDIVNLLDENYRKVIDLAYFQGYTQAEIEEELNIPIGTVKTRLRIALRELRKSFEELRNK